MTIDIDAIEARANAATPGPWAYQAVGDDGVLYDEDGDGYDVDGYDGVLLWEGQVVVSWLNRAMYSGRTHSAIWLGLEDSAFIAHAREDVPAMAAELRRLRGLEQAVRAWTSADAYTDEEAEALHAVLEALGPESVESGAAILGGTK